MTQLEFTSELEKNNINYKSKLTKWGSSYWVIDGMNYRMADHRKPSDHVSIYVFGKNDFSNYENMFKVVLKNVEKKNEVRHLTYEQQQVLSYGRYLQENDIETYNNWINHHPEFKELNK